jgi:hypothetical protein
LENHYASKSVQNKCKYILKIRIWVKTGSDKGDFQWYCFTKSTLERIVQSEHLRLSSGWAYYGSMDLRTFHKMCVDQLWPWKHAESKSFEDFFVVVILFCSTGDHTQGLAHTGQVIYHWTTPQPRIENCFMETI